MAVKTFTTGEVLTSADTNTYLANSGLVYITSATVGTAVASVTVTGAFNSTYDNYRIIVSGGSMSTGTALMMKLGTTATNGYFGTFLHSLYNVNVPTSVSDNNAAQFTYAGGGGTDNVGAVIDVLSPNLAKTSRMTATHIHYSATFGTYTGIDTAVTQHTAFILTPASGTITGSLITVYGYRKA